MKTEKLVSEFDGLVLELAVCEPEGTPKAIVQFSHGMAEHKERYFPFMEYLAQNGYVCVINDHRGHGASVVDRHGLGYFYTENTDGIVGDLHQVTMWAKKEYPELPVYLFSHSMGTLVARCYMKNYDGEIQKLVLCGPPTRNGAAGFGLVVTRITRLFYHRNSPNKILNAIAFSGFNKGNQVANGWLSYNPANVEAYNADPLCGFVFTCNGFVNLLRLQKGAYTKKGWGVKNPKLPILMIAGKDDPVIQSEKLFEDLDSFLAGKGYENRGKKLYEGMRHEILNEEKNQVVYEDVLHFFEK